MIHHFDPEYVPYEELYRAYLDCRKRKRSTHNALSFEIDENPNLHQLWYDLNSKTYAIGKSITFCVTKPVPREVFAADFRDRIVHHLVINRINGILEEEFIEDSYSCRKGKGTQYGIMRCANYIQEATNNYTRKQIIVKCDLKSFFMTIDKVRLFDKLMDFIRRKYRPIHEYDIPFIEYLLQLIIFNEPQNNCIRKQSVSHWSILPPEKSLFNCEIFKGLPIGNLTSQIFANFYLSEFDHFIKDELHIKYYGRYVDDFFIIVDSVETAHMIRKLCYDKLASMGVQLHPKKLYIQDANKGVSFIGATIKPGRIYISNRTKGNLFAALHKHYDTITKIHEQNETPTAVEIEHFAGSLNSYLGFMVHYKTFNIRKKVFQSEYMRPWLNYVYPNLTLTKVTPFREYNRHPLNPKVISKDIYYGLGLNYDLMYNANLIEQPY